MNSPRCLREQAHRRAIQRRSLKQQREKKRRGKSGGFNRPRQVPVLIADKLPALEFPETLDFEEKNKETRLFFHKLDEMIREHKHGLMIKHAGLQNLSPAAALVLIAEMCRLHREFPRHPKHCHLPEDSQIFDLLGYLGYFDYFPVSRWSNSNNDSSRFYLSHRRGEKVDPEAVKALLVHFEVEQILNTPERQALYSALVECMQNVLDHAYPNSSEYRQWWLIGYRDSMTHEISFCFYDQGVGIPETIRARLQGKVLYLSRSDSKLVRKAVESSNDLRTEDKNRGQGLPTFKRFVDSAKNASLEIDSAATRCTFTPTRTTNCDTETHLRGTLISWGLTR
jgi:hypothetical protein